MAALNMLVWQKNIGDKIMCQFAERGINTARVKGSIPTHAKTYIHPL